MRRNCVDELSCSSGILRDPETLSWRSFPRTYFVRVHTNPMVFSCLLAIHTDALLPLQCGLEAVLSFSLELITTMDLHMQERMFFALVED
jgi:hypothetical protein